MRKIIHMASLLLLYAGSPPMCLPTAAQRQSATVAAKVIPNQFSESWNAAAHNRLPLGTVLYASLPTGNRQIALKVSRRLPADLPYAMEISQAAADSLGVGGTEITLYIEYSPARMPRTRHVVADAYREVNAMNSQTPKKERIYYENEEIPPVEPPAATEAEPTPKPPVKPQPARKPAQVAKKTPPAVGREKNTKQIPFAPGATYNARGIKVAVKGFGLQLHAFNESAKAVREALNLEKKKIGKVYIQVAAAGNKASYRVIVGEYPSKSAAEKAARELKTKHKLQAIVKPHL